MIGLAIQATFIAIPKCKPTHVLVPTEHKFETSLPQAHAVSSKGRVMAPGLRPTQSQMGVVTCEFRVHASLHGG